MARLPQIARLAHNIGDGKRVLQLQRHEEAQHQWSRGRVLTKEKKELEMFLVTGVQPTIKD